MELRLPSGVGSEVPLAQPACACLSREGSAAEAAERSRMIRYALPVLLALLGAASIAAAEDTPPAPKQPAPVVSVPTYENATCPIMGKPSSKALFTDTADHGRIYVCCMPCVPKIKRDQERAYAAAYPTVRRVGNTTDPVTGKALGEDAVTVSLQGYEIRVAPASAERAKANAQIVLTLVLRSNVVDVGNLRSPISNQPVADNVFVLIDHDLVRLAAASEIEDVKRDPEKARKAAKEIAARQKAETQPPQDR